MPTDRVVSPAERWTCKYGAMETLSATAALRATWAPEEVWRRRRRSWSMSTLSTALIEADSGKTADPPAVARHKSAPKLGGARSPATPRKELTSVPDQPWSIHVAPIEPPMPTSVPSRRMLLPNVSV